MNNESSKKIAFYGISSALIFVSMFIETYVFNLLFHFAPPCFLSISIALTVILCGDKKGMLSGGIILGLCSFIIAFIIGNPVFMLPWISVLPRLFIGLTVYPSDAGLKKLFKKSNNKFIKENLHYSLSAIIGVITNTVLTLSAMLIFGKTGLEEVLAVFISINFPIEVVASAILVPVFIKAVNSAYRS